MKPDDDAPSAFVRALDEAITGLAVDAGRWRAEEPAQRLTMEDLERAIAEQRGPRRVLVVSASDYPYLEPLAEQLRADANIVEIRANAFATPGTAYVILHPDELSDAFLSPTPIQPPLRISIDDDNPFKLIDPSC